MPIDTGTPPRRRGRRAGWSATRWPVAVVALFVALAATVVPSAAEPATPSAASISVAPATDLVQGDDVTVTGSGFPADAPLAFVQCVPGTGQGSCYLGNIQYVTASPSGNVSFVFTPRRLLRVGGVTYDCALVQCRIGGGTLPDGSVASAEADIAFDPNVPPPPPPVVTVTPSTGLIEGQTVTVAGSGFEPDAGVSVVQCANPPSEIGSNCDLVNLGFVMVGGDGTFTTEFQVHRMIYNGGPTDCAVAGACVIGVGNGDPTAGDTADIQFDPSVPPPPPPTLTATPSSGLPDTVTVTVEGRGYPAHANLGMTQCLTDDQSADGCDLSNVRFVRADGAGAFTTTYTVHRTYQSPRGPVDCSAANVCRIGAGISEGGLGASALLSFGTTAVIVTPTFTG